MQSQDERDAEGFAARKERDGAVKALANEEITGRYEGEELEERRAPRPPDERFSRLKNKDELKVGVEPHEFAKVEVSKAGLAMVEVSKEKGLDTVTAKKLRRDTIAKIVGGVGGGGGDVELLHRLGVL